MLHDSNKKFGYWHWRLKKESRFLPRSSLKSLAVNEERMRPVSDYPWLGSGLWVSFSAVPKGSLPEQVQEHK